MADHEPRLGVTDDLISDDAEGVPADASSSPPPRGRRRDENPIVHAVARVPASLDRKMLVAILGIVALLVVLGVAGLRVLRGSNDRVARLGKLQERTATYQAIQTFADQLRTLLGIRSGGDIDIYEPGAPELGNVTAINNAISSTMTLFGQAADVSRFPFSPPANERSILTQIRTDYDRFSAVMARIIAADVAGKRETGLAIQRSQGEPLSNEIVDLTGHLANIARQGTQELIAQNSRSYAQSQRLFVAVAAASVALALALGLGLAWSVIVPIRRMGSRLEAIAAGDFSTHVEVPNRDELGDLARNLNRMNDELGRLYAELETVSTHKSEFLASMSHELRTPMNAIIGFSEVLRERMFGELNERQADYVEDILGAGKHLLSLINDILDLSKVEAGKMELELGPVSIPDALSNGVTMHRERATHRGIDLSLEVDPEMPPIVADERKVRQVLFNLLSNALKFTPEGGRIRVAAHASDGVVEVSVVDTGPGIPAEEIERIFEEFHQVKGTVGGTGLGLPLARRFVELHGGRLWASSSAGEGSTFTFTLPARPVEATE
jgi:signal transduction histidine kinase